MRRLSIVLAGLLLATTAATPTWAAPGAPTTTAARVAPLTPAERAAQSKAFRDGLLQGGGELMRWAINEYPDEFKRLETDVIDGMHNGTLTFAEASKRTFDFSVELRGRAMGYVAKAPDAELRRMLTQQVGLLRYFKTVNLKACYEFGEAGGLTQETAMTLGDDATKRMAAYANEIVKTVIAGQTSPVSRSPLTSADFGPIIDAYNDNGGTSAWLAASGTGDFSNVTPDQRCDSVIALLQGVLSLDDRVVGRFIVTK